MLRQLFDTSSFHVKVLLVSPVGLAVYHKQTCIIWPLKPPSALRMWHSIQQLHMLCHRNNEVGNALQGKGLDVPSRTAYGAVVTCCLVTHACQHHSARP